MGANSPFPYFGLLLLLLPSTFWMHRYRCFEPIVSEYFALQCSTWLGFGLCSIILFLFCLLVPPSFPNRETVKSSAVGAVTGLRLDLSREWIWICWEWIDIWTGSFQFQAWLHLELLSCRGQWETPQSAQFGVAAIVFYGVSICGLALPFQSLKIFLNYGCSQYVSDLDSKEEHGRLRNCPLTEATGLSWFFPSTEFDWLHGHCSKQ